MRCGPRDIKRVTAYERRRVYNHQQIDLLFSILFRRAREKISPHIDGSLWGNLQISGVPSQMSGDGKGVSMFTVHVRFNHYLKKFNNDVEYNAAFFLKSSIPRHDWWMSFHLRPSTARYRHFIGQEQTNHGRDLVSEKKGLVIYMVIWVINASFSM